MLVAKNGKFQKMNSVSVIVPVYNVENYLRECLDSIVNQTFQNLEIILVDDGSTDRSPDICDQYAREDERIKVIHKKNGGPGPGDARNVGLEYSTGRYVTSIDSDDILSLEMFDILVSVAEAERADVVACHFSEFRNSKDMPNLDELGVGAHLQCFTSEQALERLMKGELKQVVWNKIYKRDVIRGCPFEKGVVNEDEFWTYRVLGNATRIVQIAKHLLYYRQHPSSTMGSFYSSKRFEALRAMKERLNFVEERFPNLIFLAKRTFCFSGIFHYQMLLLHPGVDPKGAFRRQVTKHVGDVIDEGFISSLSVKQRIWLRLFLYMPALTSRLRNQLKVGF